MLSCVVDAIQMWKKKAIKYNEEHDDDNKGIIAIQGK